MNIFVKCLMMVLVILVAYCGLMMLVTFFSH